MSSIDFHLSCHQRFFLFLLHTCIIKECHALCIHSFNRLYSFPLSSLLPSHHCSSVDLSHMYACVYKNTFFLLFTFFKAEEKNEVRALLFQVWRRAKWLNATKWTTHKVKVLRVKIFFLLFPKIENKRSFCSFFLFKKA